MPIDVTLVIAFFTDLCTAVAKGNRACCSSIDVFVFFLLTKHCVRRGTHLGTTAVTGSLMIIRPILMRGVTRGGKSTTLVLRRLRRGTFSGMSADTVGRTIRRANTSDTVDTTIDTPAGCAPGFVRDVSTGIRRVAGHVTRS